MRISSFLTPATPLLALMVVSAPQPAAAQAPPQAMPQAMPEAEAPIPAQPLGCTFTKAFLCGPDSCAPSQTIGEIKLPAQFLVDYGRKLIATTGPSGLPHVTNIDSLASTGDNLTAQGVEGLTGWIVQTSRSQPGITFTTVDHDSVLTAFGTCKPLP